MLFLGKKTETMFIPSPLPALDNPLAWGRDEYVPSKVVSQDLDSRQGRRSCSSLQCTSSWTSPWRNRKRPLFEDQWGCSGRCVLSFVRTAVRRESARYSDGAGIPHRHRIPLGLLMLSQGWITNPQLQHALDFQRQNGGRIGDILVDECGLTPEKVTRGLGMQWSCPILGLTGFSAHEMSFVVPRPLVDQLGFVPLRIAGSKILYLGFEEHLDASAALALEQMSGLKVESGIMPTEEYQAVRSQLLERQGIELKQETFRETDAMAARITAILEHAQPVASRLVRVGRFYWLRLWLEPAVLRGAGVVPVTDEDMLDYVFTTED
ncbi:hypothetical protein JAO29_07195 [Edaphobacter sp. HDX4]|uniref:hypothetical protein n=1 Tax=Edaphobacter sp. HDX4 TaxID=2794064 RepID=UPI002FE5FEB1